VLDSESGRTGVASSMQYGTRQLTWTTSPAPTPARGKVSWTTANRGSVGSILIHVQKGAVVLTTLYDNTNRESCKI
jgi:hypothetical protein